MSDFKPICLLVAAVLSACSLVPEYRRPKTIAPEHWKQNLTGSTPVNADWWRLYGSAELDRLMAAALGANLDLSAGRERINQFRALAKIAGAPLWPAISASGGFEHADGTRSGDTDSRWQGQWAMAYEVDMWGRLRAGRDSARIAIEVARFDLDALRLVVMGDVAQSYFAILGLQERRRIAVENLANISDVLDIIVARFEAGGVSALELAQQQVERANAAAAVAELDQQIGQAENALAVLIGRAAQQFRVYGAALQGLHVPDARPGQAEALLDRRPDIRSAEAELIAAHADIGVARAAFYPRLQLGADNVFAAATLSQPAGIAVNLATSLTAPIFQGGRLEGELERTLARRTELLERYRQTILVAYREVEDALVLGKQASRRQVELEKSVEGAQHAYQLARDRFFAGAIDYETLLIVQRSLLDARDREVRARVDVYTASVLLFKSLGGGWRPKTQHEET